ncbi:MAG: hypothetical protein OEY63_03395 [Gemmatimonadota bacterium]|nr:hypothetical protein [Gemmatimonadota bacterium]MDH5804568.1 hypothetical protein [Gemmatimonadota bacterium]
MRIALIAILLVSPFQLAGQHRSADEQALLDLHAEILRAHVEGRVDIWMTLESDSYVSVNRGRITFPEASIRREQRAAYLAATTFEVYRDLRDPIVRISEDGSLGWLIAEVEIAGSAPGPDGESTSFNEIWAWVELYEKADGRWRGIGNVSNRR